MAQHNQIGQWGETLAREYLIGQGYAIYDTNVRSGHNEIDLIAFKGDVVAFVEVKTRSTMFTDPLDAVDSRKIKRLCRAADNFMRAFELRHEPRFDIITVVGTPEGSHTLTHYEDAFLPPLSGAM